MKYLFTLILAVFFTTGLVAQDEAARQKIESARIALITERLELTPDQAEKFWPIYREYQEKMNGLRQEYQQARGNVRRQDLTEEESQRLLELGMKMKEQQLGMEKTYSERLTKIITSRQLLALRKAEDDFRRMLLERLEKRREMQQRLQNRKDQIDNQ
ncbi:Spy/CpxP family protein refolding chaperone [Fulvivirga sedimenti]|uniref:Spy/CpxP family protein refolding chaperone n=1 Tax=Fulvivirga sedimenti TaxID=2879465 RepID=A0A9X1KXZ1_9BACT|nr:Spy/CpxP family protein refolding chaperone [Fulvivirga sedimenti]MCA6074702.1 Spy/CpxP family protein refolding chaperone [Fulvivirga sedimenti]MCA6075879.1 Spy/CpxP family protein refolding chaperone [Fulvivirga sedimenti]MCA6077007.1 Spy/CpxP family protein refolding chaperone [Fulvivirga sedimenti]